MNESNSDQNREPGTATVERARQLIDALNEEGITARLLGGLAVAMRCPTARPPSPLARSYSDYDIVVTRRARRRLPEALERLEFRGADRFNAMNGQVRQLYRTDEGIELDVFIQEFKMCHEIDLKSRLDVDPRTLALADLVLTKLQVARLTEKDVRDFAAMTLDHHLTDDDLGINVSRVTEVTASDWGWWKTVTDNLGKVNEHVEALGLDLASSSRVRATTRSLLERIHEAPKSLRWKARAVLGDRVAWREEPDEK